MDKTSHSVKGDGSVKGAFRQLFIDLNQMPEEEVTIDLNEPPKDDVSAPLNLYVDLRFHKEDMEVLKQKYMVLGPSSVADSDGSKDLRFDTHCHTFMCIRDRRVQFQGKSLYALGRSLFKKGFKEENEARDMGSLNSLPKHLCASMVEVRKERDENKEVKRNDTEHLAVKALLREFTEQAKARGRNARKKGKKVERHAHSTFASRRGTTKSKCFPKLRSMNALMSINNEQDT